ncbi:MAG: flavin reductase family protein [Porphyrobacter sp.]|nr:flavin reductase family protein [Porphyrobacter sp.]
MEVSPNDLPVSHRYKLMTGLIVPRPIAWVSSLSAKDEPNLAPFSYFSIASHDPLAISIAVTGRKPDGSWKDTGANLMPVDQGGTGEFVVNVVNETQAAAMAASARPVAADTSEFTLTGMSPAASRQVAPPRVAGAPAAFECRTLQMIEVGSSRLFIGQVVHIAVEDDIIDKDARVDFDKLAAVGRLAGTAYARITNRLDLADEGYFPSARRSEQ